MYEISPEYEIDPFSPGLLRPNSVLVDETGYAVMIMDNSMDGSVWFSIMVEEEPTYRRWMSALIVDEERLKNVLVDNSSFKEIFLGVTGEHVYFADSYHHPDCPIPVRLWKFKKEDLPPVYMPPDNLKPLTVIDMTKERAAEILTNVNPLPPDPTDEE